MNSLPFGQLKSFLKILIGVQYHTRSIAIGHDKKTGIPSQRLDRTIGIPVFPNMVTWNAGSDAFFAPAVLGMVDAAEACLILEHKAHFSTAPVEIFQFTDGGFKATPHNLTRRLSQDFCPNSKFEKWRNTVCISYFSN